MNVFGKNERSWRKARKRGVSPIIATILLVAITVVLAAVLYVLISGLTSGGVGAKPIGGAFSAAANGGASTSASTGGLTSLGTGAWAGTGCIKSDYCYTLTVESSSVTFTSMLFEVKTSTGAVYATGAGSGGFSIVDIGGGAVAQSSHPLISGGLAMTSVFGIFNTTAACNSNSCVPSTPLTSIYTIVVDMGTTIPSGLGLNLVAIGTGGYSGTTSVSLP